MGRRCLLLLAIVGLASASIARVGFSQVRRGEQARCIGGRPHVISFDTVGAVDDMFVPIDPTLVAGTQCDIDNTQIELAMRNASAMAEFAGTIDKRTAAYGQAFLTGSASDGTLTCANGTEAVRAARRAARLAAEPRAVAARALARGDDPNSICNGFATCNECLQVSFCDYCPLQSMGSTRCFNGGNIHLKSKCRTKKSCVGPDCAQPTCPAGPNVTETDYVLRRIISYDAATDGSNVLTVHAVPVKYDEIFSDANITSSRVADRDFCDARELGGGAVGSTPWCLGFNVNNDFSDPMFCKSSAGSFPIFDKTIGPATLNIDCTDCFVGYQWDFVFELHMKLFKVEEIRFGFSNMSAMGSTVITMTAELQSTVAIDKQLDLMPGGAANVDFNVGIIPFHATIDVPTALDATFSFDAKATATVGTNFVANYGDNYKVWTQADGWDHVKGTPAITHGQVLDGGKNWNANFDFSLLPTVNFAMDSVFTYTYTVTNTYHSDAAWDSASEQLCEEGNAASNAIEVAQLAINVPFIKLSLAKQWGPFTKWDWSKDFPKKCVNVTA